MKTSLILLTLASITTAVFSLGIFLGFASTGLLLASISLWMGLSFVVEYGPRVTSHVPRRQAVRIAAACMKKSHLRLAA